MGTRSGRNVGDGSPAEERDQTIITTSIGGSVSGGQVAIGRDNTLIRTTEVVTPVSQADLIALREAVDALKAQVAAQAPPEKRAAAVQQLDALQAAMTADKPKVSTMANVRDWFVKNIPTMAGAVTAIVINPIVGKLVQAGGDELVGEFRHHFGPTR